MFVPSILVSWQLNKSLPLISATYLGSFLEAENRKNYQVQTPNGDGLSVIVTTFFRQQIYIWERSFGVVWANRELRVVPARQINSPPRVKRHHNHLPQGIVCKQMTFRNAFPTEISIYSACAQHTIECLVCCCASSLYLDYIPRCRHNSLDVELLFLGPKHIQIFEKRDPVGVEECSE